MVIATKDTFRKCFQAPYNALLANKCVTFPASLSTLSLSPFLLTSPSHPLIVSCLPFHSLSPLLPPPFTTNAHVQISTAYSSTSNEEDDDIYRKRKKARTAFSREQVADLEKKFQEKKYLSSAERGELAEKLKLSDMQVKTWFQNRRMKYKRQSEEAEMEMKSPKYPYSSFVSYGGMGPLYGYVPMPYKAHDGGSGLSVPYTYATSALRSPQQTTSPITGSAMDVNFVMNHSSPSMLGPLPSPLSAGMSPRHSFPTPLPRPNGTSSYFNGLLTPISPSTGYQHSYFNTNEGVGSVGNHTHVQGFSDWPRAIPAPTTP